jgi:hypothetical protein
MAARTPRPARCRQLHHGGVLRRVAVTVVAGGLVVAAEIAATLSPAPVHQVRRHHPTATLRVRSPAAEPGEPELRPGSSVPSLPRTAAVTFVRDYSLWSGGQVASLSGRDMTRRVGGLLEHARTLATVDVANAVSSVRIARAPRGTYVVTSAIGNFLVGRERSRWLVISLPGD